MLMDLLSVSSDWTTNFLKTFNTYNATQHYPLHCLLPANDDLLPANDGLVRANDGLLPANETRDRVTHSNISAENALSIYKTTIIPASIVGTYKFGR